MARARRGRLSGPRPTSAKRCTCSWKNPRARRGYMGRAGSGHNCEVLNMVAARKGNHRHLVILRKVTEPTILLPICGRSSSSRATIARLARARSFVRRESEPLRAQPTAIPFAPPSCTLCVCVCVSWRGGVRSSRWSCPRQARNLRIPYDNDGLVYRE